MKFVNRKLRAAKILTVFCFLLLPLNNFAQHCPFDGTYAVVIELVDSKDKHVADITDGLVLQEVDNDRPQLCTFAPELLTIEFKPAKKAFYELRDPERFPDTVKRYCPDCKFLEDGFYSAKLTQATETCMMKTESNDYNYKKRKFEVQFTHNGETHKVTVPKDQVYSLCTARGRWERIQPIKIKV
jgi:hypothetical protein